MNSVLGNEFRRSVKDRGLNIDTDVVRYEEQDVRPRDVGSETVPGIIANDPDEFNCCRHGVELNFGICL